MDPRFRGDDNVGWYGKALRLLVVQRHAVAAKRHTKAMAIRLGRLA
jgi:hypothetical protein